jgi:outer membrane protein assembly factor BamB
MSLDTLLLATVNINEHPLATAGMFGNHPDEIVFAGGFIWTKTDNGHVIQVDPATNTMVGAIKVDTTTDSDHYCQGLGTDGENIWACSASGEEEDRTIDVVRIDPETQSVVATVKVGKTFDQFDMPFLANQIWVLSGNGDKLVGIDASTNQPGLAIELGTRCFQLAVVDKVLLATCALDNLVLQIDPEKREVTAQLILQSPRNIAATENGVWVIQDNAIVRLDPDTLHPVVTFTNLPGIGYTGDIFATEEAVWVRQESGFLYRIDPTSNELIEQIKPDQILTGGSVLVTSDSIWTTANEDDLLIRLGLE